MATAAAAAAAIILPPQPMARQMPPPTMFSNEGHMKAEAAIMATEMAERRR